MNGTAMEFKPDWTGIIKWGGLALLLAGGLLLVFIAIVFASQQILPVPARQAMEDPFVPDLMFTIAAIGEVALLPGFVALYFRLRTVAHTPMAFAVMMMAVSSPLFVISRIFVVAMSPLKERFTAAAPAMKNAYLAAAELGVEIQNMIATAALILLCLASILAGLTIIRSKYPNWVGILAIAAGLITVFSPFPGDGRSATRRAFPWPRGHCGMAGLHGLRAIQQTCVSGKDGFIGGTDQGLSH